MVSGHVLKVLPAGAAEAGTQVSLCRLCIFFAADERPSNVYGVECGRAVCAGRCVCRHSHDPRVKEEAGRGSKSENR